MSETFDAYHELLGIPPAEQPPNHYRLLGVAAFETSQEVISNAAAARSQYLRRASISDYAEVCRMCQRLLNEVAEAKLCLLNPAKREAYDRQLRAALCDGAVSREAQRETASGKPQPADRTAARRVAGESAAAGPDEASVTIEQSWLIGRSPECDVVVGSPSVSQQHCRLMRTPQGLLLEDLQSRNGTYVNRVPIVGRVGVSPRDRITLGKKTPMPWPPGAVSD